MKKNYLVTLGKVFVSLIVLNGCGTELPFVNDKKLIQANSPSLFKDENDTVIVGFNVDHIGYDYDPNHIDFRAYQVIDFSHRLIDINRSEFLEFRSRYLTNVECLGQCSQDQDNISDIFVKKYNLKDITEAQRPVSAKDQVRVIPLLDNSMLETVGKYFVSIERKDLHFFTEMKEGQYLIKQLQMPTKELALDFSYTIDGRFAPIMIPDAERYKDPSVIYVFSFNGETIEFRPINLFIEEYYGYSFDALSILRELYEFSTTQFSFYNDGMYILYDKELQIRDSQMVYKHIRYDSPDIPTIIDVPL